MDYIKKFIYIYLFVLLINKFRDFNNSAYSFYDSIHVGINIFGIKSIDLHIQMDFSFKIYFCLFWFIRIKNWSISYFIVDVI